MHEIRITVRGGLAQTEGRPEIICGNSDYTAVFDLDAPWNLYQIRCARFVWKDLESQKLLYTDVLFEGDTAVIPPIYNTDLVLAGIYAGTALTSTPVRILCRGCATDNEPVHGALPADLYEQLYQYFLNPEPIIWQAHGTLLLTSAYRSMAPVAAPECIHEPIAAK